MVLVLQVSLGLAAQTRYYERVMVVRNGQREAASGDGHYITFVRDIAYDSNPDGTRVSKWTLDFMSDKNNRHLYEGNSALGFRLSYVFSWDYDRLNVKTNDDIVYVYEHKRRPSGGSERRYDLGGHVAVDDVYMEYGGDESSASTQQRAGGSGASRRSSHRETCPRCHGTKYIDKYVPSVASYGNKPPEYYDCPICGKRVAKNGGHGHATCPECHGAGTIIKYD